MKEERFVRNDAVKLEEARLNGIESIEDYSSVHERHRIFPDIFENRSHKKIIDISAGVGIVGRRIKEFYDADVLCNDISPTCLKTMERAGLRTVSFDIDDAVRPFPLPDGSFDAVVSLATIEHLVNIDHFLQETHRILNDAGRFYVSAPNYSGLLYLVPFLVSGKTFHDPMSKESRYEFYAHVRYFTYRTMVEFIGSFGFAPEAVYLALPRESSRYKSLQRKSRLKASLFRHAMRMAYWMSPRWASEPVLCFRKNDGSFPSKVRKVIL
jgi:SAM-dependent methyltransferase